MPATKRKRDSDSLEDDSDDNDARRTHDHKRFAFLKPRVRHVAERTIKSKWTTLPEPVQEKVRDMFKSLERPVIVRHHDERKRIEAQTAVGAVVRNLAKRLPRMPFPPVTKDTSFDYEAALDENRALEAQLATVTNSVDLLKAEVEKEEALLAKETRQLEELEKNAKRAEAERKRQMKNEHPILRQLDDLSSSHGRDQKLGRFAAPEIRTDDVSLCDYDPDPELQALIKQLNGHLQSMQNNIAPLAGLRDAIILSRAALDLLSVPTD